MKKITTLAGLLAITAHANILPIINYCQSTYQGYPFADAWYMKFDYQTQTFPTIYCDYGRKKDGTYAAAYTLQMQQPAPSAAWQPGAKVQLCKSSITIPSNCPFENWQLGDKS